MSMLVDVVVYGCAAVGVLAVALDAWRIVDNVRDWLWLWARRHAQLPSRGRVGQARAVSDDVRDGLWRWAQRQHHLPSSRHFRKEITGTLLEASLNELAREGRR